MWKENRLKRIDSTQKEAIRRIKTGKINKPEFFYSFDQFDGYGTHGRKWEKSKESLAISFAWPKLLTPKLDKIIFPIIFSTFVVEDIEKFMNYPKYSLGLKWPNDLMKEEKKIGGVLVQTINQNLEEWFVVGLGINLFWCPLDFNHSYGSLLTNNDECFPKDELVSTVFETMRKIFLICI
mgnify:CR=1 FL=1